MALHKNQTLSVICHHDTESYQTVITARDESQMTQLSESPCKRKHCRAQPLLKHMDVVMGAHVIGSGWQAPDHAALQAEAEGSQVFLGPRRPREPSENVDPAQQHSFVRAVVACSALEKYMRPGRWADNLL